MAVVVWSPRSEGRLARTVFYVDVSTSALPRNLIT